MSEPPGLPANSKSLYSTFATFHFVEASEVWEDWLDHEANLRVRSCSVICCLRADVLDPGGLE